MKMKKADWIILISAMLLFGSLMLGMSFYRQNGASVVGSVDGREVAAYPLDEDRTEVIRGYDGGENVLSISGHSATILSADCPDKSCVHQKAIRFDGETIVCLPHRVMVLIRSDEESEIDAVTR